MTAIAMLMARTLRNNVTLRAEPAECVEVTQRSLADQEGHCATDPPGFVVKKPLTLGEVPSSRMRSPLPLPVWCHGQGCAQAGAS